MDGMMHKLKAEAREISLNTPAVRKPPEKGKLSLEELEAGMRRVPMFDCDPVMTFKATKRHPSMAIPDFESCRQQFLIMLHKGGYAFVMLRIDNLDELFECEAEGVLQRLSEGLAAYIGENPTLAACTRRGEVAILLRDVDAMDEEDDTLGWFSKALPLRRQADQPKVFITAVVTDLAYPRMTCAEDLDDMIETSREAFELYNEHRSSSPFVWGPTEY